MREKTRLKIKAFKQRKSRVHARFLILAAIAFGIGFLPIHYVETEALNCPDLKIVFARGSGGERWRDQNYLEFKKQIEDKLPASGFSYEFLDLDYPAVGVGLDNLGVTLGAFFGAGESYEFGNSVDAGVNELIKVVNSECGNTKYVLGGYSQGAMVISKALGSLNANKIVYVATFGDPKIYLPEGFGFVPSACYGQNLSNYRIYVPDCRAFEGLLGSYKYYQLPAFENKLGTWCNKYDIFCSSYFSIGSHTSYISDNLYDDAARIIVDKIAAAFGVGNSYSSPHDTVILIDSNTSTGWLIENLKREAIQIANETFAIDGRIALYDYHNSLTNSLEPVMKCDFETCSSENFADHLNDIIFSSGGGMSRSLLSASSYIMNQLRWRRGATKSLIILTDSPFLSPDYDGTTMQDVIRLSKEIDPVNFYIATDEEAALRHPELRELAEATGGMLVTDFETPGFLASYIMGRYDSLPRVEEVMEANDAPILEVINIRDSGTEVQVKFNNTGQAVLVILNDAVLGIIEGDTVTINNLDRTIENELVLVPIGNDRRGERVLVEIPIVMTGTENIEEKIVPKAPDTGQPKGTL